MTPGILTIDAAAYHADKVADQPTLSASVIRDLCMKSPLHAWTNHPKLNPNYKPTVKDAFDLGHCAHGLFLEGDANVEVVDAADWRTKDAKEAKEAARLAGRTPMLRKDWERVQELADAIERQTARFPADPLLFTSGESERTVVWQEGDVACKARLDWLRDDYAAIDDLKTTSKSADPRDWSRTLFNIGADIQVAWYLRGVNRVTRATPEFRYVVIETYPPYAMSVVSVPPAALALANRKIEWALTTWQECLSSGHWPGYPAQVCWADPPTYAETAWLDHEEAVAA